MNTAATQDKLKIYPSGRGIWRCENGQNNYKIVDIGAGRYQCNCPARVECRHVKQLKELQGIQAAIPAKVAPSLWTGRGLEPEKPTEIKPNSDERRTGDRRQSLEPEVRAEVARLRLELSQVRQLGFTCDRTYVFIDSKYGGVWYTLDRNDKPQPIEAFSLNGYIRKIEFKVSGEGPKASSKLLCFVDADKQYILRTGHNTHFAKGLLMALSVLPPERLARPVRINPQVSKTTILCNLHQDGELIRARYGDDTDWRSVSIQAMENLRSADRI